MSSRRKATSHLNVLSLNAPWNCVTIKLQKPNCQRDSSSTRSLLGVRHISMMGECARPEELIKPQNTRRQLAGFPYKAAGIGFHSASLCEIVESSSPPIPTHISQYFGCARSYR